MLDFIISVFGWNWTIFNPIDNSVSSLDGLVMLVLFIIHLWGAYLYIFFGLNGYGRGSVAPYS